MKVWYSHVGAWVSGWLVVTINEQRKRYLWFYVTVWLYVWGIERGESSAK